VPIFLARGRWGRWEPIQITQQFSTARCSRNPARNAPA